MYSYVCQRLGCGSSHKYTNMYCFYSVNCCKYFRKQYYRSSLCYKKFIYRITGVYI